MGEDNPSKGIFIPCVASKEATTLLILRLIGVKANVIEVPLEVTCIRINGLLILTEIKGSSAVILV